jgi:hypothetical protein
MPDWKSPMRADPSEWLVLNASAPIKLRLLTELHSLSPLDPNIVKLKTEVRSWAPAKAEIRYQRQDGSWGGVIHAGEGKKAERSTERVLWYYHELGWDKEVKEIKKAAKLLKSFLAQKSDVSLFEFKSQVKQDPVRERHVRWFLRIVALGLLARGGWADERRVLDSIADLLERSMAFVANPVSRKPVERVGVGLPQLRRETLQDGYCFIPDVYSLRVFAHTPVLLDSPRARNMLKRIFDYVMSPDYQDLGADMGTIRTARGPIPRGWGIQLPPIDKFLDAGALEELLYLLEQFARLGLINRYPQLMSYLEWFLAHQEKDGRWDLNAKYFGNRPNHLNWIRLDKDWKSPQRRVADVTFRLMLILRYQFERQVKMLDRGADLYGL